MAPRKKAQPKTPVSRQEALKQSLITAIVAILNDVKKPDVENKAVPKLTAQQQAAVDSLNRNDFGCQRKQVIDLVSAIVGKDLSELVSKEVDSEFTFPVALKWNDNDEIGVGLKQNSDHYIGFSYIDSDGDQCFDWIDADNFTLASTEQLVKALTAAKVGSVAKILSDITEQVEN